MFLVNCFTHLTRKAVEDVEEGFATCPHVLPAFCASPTGAPPLLLSGGLWRGTPRGGGWWSGLFEAEGTTPRESSSSFPPQLAGPLDNMSTGGGGGLLVYQDISSFGLMCVDNLAIKKCSHGDLRPCLRSPCFRCGERSAQGRGPST